MSEAAENKQGADAGGESPSMEEILKSIRGVISGDEAGAAPAVADGAAAADDSDDEILELTEMEIEGDGSAVAPAESAAPVAEVEKLSGEEVKSVLDDIDEALGDDSAKEADAAVEKAKEEAAANAAMEAEFAAAAGEAAKPAEATESKDDVLEAAEEEKVVAAEQKADSADLASFDAGADTKADGKLLKDDVADKSAETMRELVSNIPRTQVSSPYTKGGTTLEELTIAAMRPFLAEWLNENLPTIVKHIVSKEIKKLIPEDDDK